MHGPMYINYIDYSSNDNLTACPTVTTRQWIQTAVTVNMCQTPPRGTPAWNLIYFKLPSITLSLLRFVLSLSNRLTYQSPISIYCINHLSSSVVSHALISGNLIVLSSKTVFCTIYNKYTIIPQINTLLHLMSIWPCIIDINRGPTRCNNNNLLIFRLAQHAN